MAWNKIYRALLICFFTLLTIEFSMRICFAVTDSTGLSLPVSIPMAYSNVYATIEVSVPISAPIGGGGCNAGTANVFYFVASCPYGSSPQGNDDTITGTDLQNCFNGAPCKKTISYNSTASYQTNPCGPNPAPPRSFIAAPNISTKVTCNLALQGWFPASEITPLYTKTPIGAAAPVMSFNFGTLKVTYNSCGWYCLQCNAPSSTLIPGGYQFCYDKLTFIASWYP